MHVYVTGERGDAGKKQLKQGPADVRYRYQEEEIRMKDINMASMATIKDAMITQLWTTPGETGSRHPCLRASGQKGISFCKI